MRIKTINNQKYVELGSQEIFFALYSTVSVRLKEKEKYISNAVEFMKSGNCKSDIALSVAKEFNLIRDYLSCVSLDNLVYDMRDLNKKAPWINDISPVITSCGNLFVTKDGRDTLYEIVSLLTFAYYEGVDVVIEK